MATTQLKRCRCCNQEKAPVCFSKRAASADGLQHVCKDCYRLAHLNGGKMAKTGRECSVCKRTLPADRFRKATNRWVRAECLECEKVLLRCCKCEELKKHECFAPDKVLQTGRKSHCRACDAAHQAVARKAEAYKRKRRSYRSQPHNREKDRAYNTAYFLSEDGKKAMKKYAQSIKGYAARTRRRAKEMAVLSTLTAAEWLEILESQEYQCFYCHRKFGPRLKAEQDHIIPISKYGPHVKENVVAACRHCNSSKNNKGRPVTKPTIDEV